MKTAFDVYDLVADLEKINPYRLGLVQLGCLIFQASVQYAQTGLSKHTLKAVAAAHHGICELADCLEAEAASPLYQHNSGELAQFRDAAYAFHTLFRGDSARGYLPNPRYAQLHIPIERRGGDLPAIFNRRACPPIGAVLDRMEALSVDLGKRVRNLHAAIGVPAARGEGAAPALRFQDAAARQPAPVLSFDPALRSAPARPRVCPVPRREAEVLELPTGLRR